MHKSNSTKDRDNKEKNKLKQLDYLRKSNNRVIIIGGFFNNPEEELLVRWHQAGAFQPLLSSRSGSLVSLGRHLVVLLAAVLSGAVVVVVVVARV